MQKTRQDAHDEIMQSGEAAKNRYGEQAKFPAFIDGGNVPVLALINPLSGAKAGKDILQVAHRDPRYARCFFNIINVIKSQKRGGLMDVFRIELNKAKDEALKKNTRPRVISAGGDGTATFAMFVIFKTLQADESRADDGLSDTGNGFIWTDEELAASFPALAQMPLGSANDCGNILGWGQVYPGDGQCLGPAGRAAKLTRWIEALLSPSSLVVPFDMWGIMPAPGSNETNFKICELTGNRGVSPRVKKDGKMQLSMKTTGNPVPFFISLYFSVGFFGYVVARFQLNRHNTPFQNTLEYIRQGASVIVAERTPPQMKTQLEGISIDAGGAPYFPPRRDRGNKASKYREVGFYNVNWQAHKFHGYDRAGCLTRMNPFNKRQPVKFQDGLLDLQRQKLLTLAKNPGFKMQTDKRSDFHLKYDGGEGKGIFFQYDGEARFAFRPDGGPFDIFIRQVMTIPVVIGPWVNNSLTGELDTNARFEFFGSTPQEKEEVKSRLQKNLNGSLEAEMCATKAELQAANLEN